MAIKLALEVLTSVLNSFVDASMILYFSLYSPMLYIVFLKDYFHPPANRLAHDSYAVYEYDVIN